MQKCAHIYVIRALMSIIYRLGRLYLIEFGFDYMTEITFVPSNSPGTSVGVKKGVMVVA